MPAKPKTAVPLKRKHTDKDSGPVKAIAKKQNSRPGSDEILNLERVIVESQKNYNSIATLIEYLQVGAALWESGEVKRMLTYIHPE
jgi:hypothetical protein